MPICYCPPQRMGTCKTCRDRRNGGPAVDIPASISGAVAASGSLVEQLRKPFISAFMDGRNEHGTHLLAMGPQSIFYDACKLMGDWTNEENEAIFARAEALGHKQGHSIAILLREVRNPDSCNVYYEVEDPCPILTAAFFGTAAEQEKAIYG